MGAVRNLKEQANVVIYARYSSHGQQDQSIDGQLRDCHAFAEREELVVVGEYIDRAISAKTDARPDFRHMISDAAKKQYQYVIVCRLGIVIGYRKNSLFSQRTYTRH